MKTPTPFKPAALGALAILAAVSINGCSHELQSSQSAATLPYYPGCDGCYMQPGPGFAGQDRIVTLSDTEMRGLSKLGLIGF